MPGRFAPLGQDEERDQPRGGRFVPAPAETEQTGTFTSDYQKRQDEQARVERHEATQAILQQPKARTGLFTSLVSGRNRQAVGTPLDPQNPPQAPQGPSGTTQAQPVQSPAKQRIDLQRRAAEPTYKPKAQIGPTITDGDVRAGRYRYAPTEPEFLPESPDSPASRPVEPEPGLDPEVAKRLRQMQVYAEAERLGVPITAPAKMPDDPGPRPERKPGESDYAYAGRISDWHLTNRQREGFKPRDEDRPFADVESDVRSALDAERLSGAREEAGLSGRATFAAKRAAVSGIGTTTTDLYAGIARLANTAENAIRTRIGASRRDYDPDKDLIYNLLDYGTQTGALRDQLSQDPLAGGWEDMLAQGLGSTAGFASTGWLSTALKTGRFIPIAVTGSAVNTEQLYSEALDMGASQEDAEKMALWSVLAGSLEAVPISRAFGRFEDAYDIAKGANRATKGRFFKTMLKHGIGEGFEESLQEVTQQGVNNYAIARYIDENRSVFDGMLESGGVGGAVGALMGALFSAAGVRRARFDTPEQRQAAFDEVAKIAGEAADRTQANVDRLAQRPDLTEPAETRQETTGIDESGQERTQKSESADDSIPPAAQAQAEEQTTPDEQPGDQRTDEEYQSLVEQARREAEAKKDAPVAPEPAPAPAATGEGERVAKPTKTATGEGYDPKAKYHQIIPEVKQLDPARLRPMDAGEVSGVDAETAEKMDFSEPVKVSVFADGTTKISDGHHRVAAAKQRGLKRIPVELQAINATGETIQSLINESQQEAEDAQQITQNEASDGGDSARMEAQGDEAPAVQEGRQGVQRGGRGAGEAEEVGKQTSPAKPAGKAEQTSEQAKSDTQKPENTPKSPNLANKPTHRLVDKSGKTVSEHLSESAAKDANSRAGGIHKVEKIEASASAAGQEAKDKTPAAQATAPDLAKLSKKDLITRMRDAGLKPKSSMTKTQMVEALEGKAKEPAKQEKSATGEATIEYTAPSGDRNTIRVYRAKFDKLPDDMKKLARDQHRAAVDFRDNKEAMFWGDIVNGGKPVTVWERLDDGGTVEHRGLSTKSVDDEFADHAGRGDRMGDYGNPVINERGKAIIEAAQDKRRKKQEAEKKKKRDREEAERREREAEESRKDVIFKRVAKVKWKRFDKDVPVRKSRQDPDDAPEKIKVKGLSHNGFVVYKPREASRYNPNPWLVHHEGAKTTITSYETRDEAKIAAIRLSDVGVKPGDSAEDILALDKKLGGFIVRLAKNPYADGPDIKTTPSLASRFNAKADKALENFKKNQPKGGDPRARGGSTIGKDLAYLSQYVAYKTAAMGVRRGKALVDAVKKLINEVAPHYADRWKDVEKRVRRLHKASLNDDGTVDQERFEREAAKLVAEVSEPPKPPQPAAQPEPDDRGPPYPTVPDEKDKPEGDFPPDTFSARQAQVNQDRERWGKPGLQSRERRTWSMAVDTARKRGFTDPDRAMAKAASVIERPRALDDVETAGLVEHGTKLKREHARLQSEIGKTDDPAVLADLAAQINRVEQDFEVLTNALFASGSEKGRALASQKLTLNMDMDLVSVLNRAKAAKGKKLTDKERSQLEQMTNKHEEYEKKIEELQARIDELMADRTARANSRRRYAKMNKAQKDADLRNRVSRVAELLKAGCD